ncbi:hypothetical protein GCM10028808_55120 [Spirosoma migulaei]
MKTASFILVLLLSAITFGYAQTTAPAPADFFAGKWEITIIGTPAGDAKMVTNLVRKDGKLTGELTDPTGVRPVTPISKVEEGTDKITLSFESPQAGEVSIELAKADADHLKGQLMNMFEATAVRAKQ